MSMRSRPSTIAPIASSTWARAFAVSGRSRKARRASSTSRGARRPGRRRRAPAAKATCISAIFVWRGQRQLSRATRPMRPIRNRTPNARPIQPERSGLGEQALDQIGGPQPEGERDEAAEAGQRSAEAAASGARSPAFCAVSISRSASSIPAPRRSAESGRSATGDGGRRERRGRVVDGDARVVEPEGARAGRALAHASRSPIRNCRARSSRMCGAGWPRARDRRPEAQEAPVVVGLGQGERLALEDQRPGSAGNSPGNTAASATPLKVSPPSVSPAFGHADDRLEDLAAAGGSRPRGWRGSRRAR